MFPCWLRKAMRFRVRLRPSFIVLSQLKNRMLSIGSSSGWRSRFQLQVEQQTSRQAYEGKRDHSHHRKGWVVFSLAKGQSRAVQAPGEAGASHGSDARQIGRAHV